MAGEGKAHSGYLEVADFVDVVWFPKEEYPKGIRKYHVAQGDKDQPEEKQA